MIPPIVDPGWLSDHSDILLADVRSYFDGRVPKEEYEKRHLPGAVHVDLDRWLAAPPGPEGRHPMPTPEVFAEGMSQAGIGDDTVVVAYDDDHGVMAARLVWMLRVLGHPAAVLDGGITAWRGPVESGPHLMPQASFTPVPWPADRMVGIDELDGKQLIDARPEGRFHGVGETIDPRAGHIPGARSVPCRESSDDRGVLRPALALREHLGHLEEGWVSYCGSGVTACHNLLVAEHVGLPQGLLFPGSWSQWAATDRPAEL